MATDDTVVAEFTLRPIGAFKHVSDVAYWGMTDRGPLHVFFPTRDRRKARRVARALKVRFRRGADGYVAWKDGTNGNR